MPSYSLDIGSEDDFDFDVFSITSTESIYRIVFEINSALNIDLQLNDLLDYTHKEGQDFYFPVYTYLHEELNIEFNLLPNQTSFQPLHARQQQQAQDLFGGDIEHTTKLLPELETTDYFLLIKGDNRLSYNHTVFKTIRSVASFQLVEEIVLDRLKDKKAKGNLLF